MRVVALVVAAAACKGSSAPEQDKRAPAQAPVALAADAAPDAPPEAPSGPCFALPFGLDAERAGIVKLRHAGRPPKPRARKLPGVTLLRVGKPTRVAGLKPPEDGSPLRVPDIGADALVATATITASGVALTAPAHLESAVIRVDGETNALVAVEEAGLASLLRYRDEYVPSRRSAADTKQTIEPVAVFGARLGNVPDGLLSYSAVSDSTGTHLEVGILWHPSGSLTPQIGYATIATTSLYVVPPTLSGGTTLLVGLDGTRIAIDSEKLTLTTLSASPANPRCLQTSTAAHAQFIE